MKFFTLFLQVLLELWSFVVKKNDPIQDQVESDEIVYQALEDILKRVNADRICVHNFHNGGIFYSGQPVQKFSCLYEVKAPGISTESRNRQKILISSYNQSFLHLLRQQSIKIKNVPNYIKKHENDLNSDVHFIEDLSKRGVLSTHIFTVKHFNGNCIGFVTLEFVKSYMDFSNPDYDVITKNFAKQMSGYLSKPSRRSQNHKYLKILLIILWGIVVMESYLIFKYFF